MSSRKQKSGIVSFAAVLFTIAGLFKHRPGRGFGGRLLRLDRGHVLGSTLVIAVDILVIWGLTAHADLFVRGGPTGRTRLAPSPRGDHSPESVRA